MNSDVEEYHEKQFQRIGMAEAYNDQVKEQMSQGPDEIRVKLAKEIEGDSVEALIYLKKLPALDSYEIKRFDLSLKKESPQETLTHKFNIGESRKVYNDEGKPTFRQNRYTMKEGYNLLSGRPVYKRLVSRDGVSYEAWVKLNLNRRRPDGNYEMQYTTKNRGLNLDSVLKEYPIKELHMPKYLGYMMESLNRGNLQWATFQQKDGSEQRLFISPNLNVDALNVYDGDKKLIPTKALMERGLISNELGKKLLIGETMTREQKPQAQLVPSKEQKQEQKPDQKNRPKLH